MARGNAAQTRERLLQAGSALAAQSALSALRIDDVVQGAGVAKGTFYLHFADRSEFLVALHQRFHAAIRARVEQAIAGGESGLARLLAGSTEYLDACREQSAVKALLMEARTEPAIQREVARQNAGFALMAAEEFRAAGWPQPPAAARLWVGMVAEAALAEAEAGAVLQPLRAALAYFLLRT